MAVFVSDTFTDADGVAIPSHTGETGATWTAHPAYSSGGTIQSNRAVPPANTNLNVFYASGLPASNEYDVEAVLHVAGSPAAETIAGVWARLDTTANTGYFWRAYKNVSGYQLVKAVSGSLTVLGSYTSTLPATGDAFKLECRAAAKKGFVGGVERVSSSDNAVTPAGRVGIFLRDYRSSAGYSIASVTASDPAGSGVTGTGSLTDAGETLSGSGSVTAAGAGSLTDGGEALAGAGAVAATGTGALTDAGETLSGAGAVRVTGTGALTDGGETLSGSGALSVTATGVLTDGGDLLSGSGAVRVTGSGSLTDGGETVSGSDAAAAAVVLLGDLRGEIRQTLLRGEVRQTLYRGEQAQTLYRGEVRRTRYRGEVRRVTYHGELAG